MDGIPDHHDCYEVCVQSPEHAAPLLRAIHGGGGGELVLGEDFAGTASLAREWIRTDPAARAVCVDRDPEVCARARRECVDDRLVIRCADIMEMDEPCDLLYTGNFSIGYRLSRPDLLAYMRHVRARLNPGGVFVCDTYGGESAFTLGSIERVHPLPGGGWIVYTWEQREADPLTARVRDVLHFRVFDEGGDAVADYPDAFVYDWRLWSVPELRETMLEAGFATTAVYAGLADAVDEQGRAYVLPIEDAQDELDDSFIVCVVGRA